jgi:hypothetical protein
MQTAITNSPAAERAAFLDRGNLGDAALRKEVAQVSNLPYRGFPIRPPSFSPKRQDSSNGLPTGSRRYSRLETCATLIAASPCCEIPCNVPFDSPLYCVKNPSRKGLPVSNRRTRSESISAMPSRPGCVSRASGRCSAPGSCPGGTSGNSPTVQRWAGGPRLVRVPKGRLRGLMGSAVPSGLMALLRPVPSVETLSICTLTSAFAFAQALDSDPNHLHKPILPSDISTT